MESAEQKIITRSERSGEAAIVTGASSGIGAAISRRLCGLGYEVFGFARHFESEAETEVFDGAEQFHPIVCDVLDTEHLCACVKQIASEHLVRILVNNAGITRDNLMIKMSEADFDQVVSTNLKGTFHTIKHLYRNFMKLRGGRIINISSVWGVVGASCEVAYSATKGAINSFTMALAKELAPSNIPVNAIACGIIDTEMNSCFSKEDIQAIIEEIPANRLGRPSEVANLAVLLARAPQYLTGQVITIDGGWT